MKIHVPKVEFYITNVCNLECNGCNRFNNLNFKGWQNWDDYAEIYKKWAEYITIDHIVILGGEPFLNPTLVKWVKGLKSIWPESGIQILTNGTRFDWMPDLLQACAETLAWVGVSMHHNSYKTELFASIGRFLNNNYEFSEDSSGNLPVTGGHYRFVSGNVKVIVWKQGKFTQNSLLPGVNGKHTLHNSDPGLAHKACSFARLKVYHFIRGKLYKCGPVALFPEIDQQLGLDLSHEDRQLVNGYQPYTLDNIEQYKDTLIQNIDQVIPQCKFCPEKFNHHKLDFVPIKVINFDQ